MQKSISIFYIGFVYKRYIFTLALVLFILECSRPIAVAVIILLYNIEGNNYEINIYLLYFLIHPLILK